MNQTVVMFLTSLVFGAGLEISQMSNPQKVQDFLTPFTNWDPSLAFVMVGAIGVNALFYFWSKKKTKPLFAPNFHIPNRKDINPKLVGGAFIFGIGWGLSGLCPGPTMVNAYRMQPELYLAIGALILGMFVHWLIFERGDKSS